MGQRKGWRERGAYLWVLNPSLNLLGHLQSDVWEPSRSGEEPEKVSGYVSMTTHLFTDQLQNIHLERLDRGRRKPWCNFNLIQWKLSTLLSLTTSTTPAVTLPLTTRTRCRTGFTSLTSFWYLCVNTSGTGTRTRTGTRTGPWAIGPGLEYGTDVIHQFSTRLQIHPESITKRIFNVYLV